jgi:hypothetical protein
MGFTSRVWKKFCLVRENLKLTCPTVCILVVAAASGGLCAPVEAREWFVAAGGSGSGTESAPFGRIQDGLAVAQPGDVVTVAGGTYEEALRTVRSGTALASITLRAADGRGSVVVTTTGRVLTVDHAYAIVEGLVLDGQYGVDDTIRISNRGHFFQLRDSEVRRSSRDLIDIGSPQGVLIDGCLIHHALNSANGRTDAHGIVAGAVQDLTVRNTEIHTFSGDGVQVDPGRAVPGWNHVTIEGSRIWLAPLPVAENGFAAGSVPGENAVDTKANANATRATMVIRDVVAYGFRGGLIPNMAAFNLKENVNVMVDRVTVYDSEIAFRLRGPTSARTAGAWVTVQDAVVYASLTAFRYENNIEQLRIWNSTLGRAVTRPFQAASSSVLGLEVRNLLMLNAQASEASHPSNLTVGPEAFINANADNYQLAAGSAAIDAGITLADVKTDRLGVQRPQGPNYDVGAYERPALQSISAPAL